ncbi:MAG: Ig-like domain-containing protein [Planctomycetota bacterium]
MYVFPKRRRPAPILSIENLEIRNLLSGIMSADLPAAIPESDPNETLDQATDLGSSGSGAVNGTIDRNGVDVDWYSFTLLVSSEVTLDSTFGTIGLYNNASRDPLDRLNPLGYRLLAQETSLGSVDAQITRTLAAGTYYVAVSGKGNSYFNPFLADSGLAGETGAYTFQFTSAAQASPVGGDPAPLTVDASPLGVRVGFAGNLSFSPTVELTDAAGNLVSLSWTNFNSAISELQFAPNKALTAGNYTATIKDSTGAVRMTLQVRVPSATAGSLDQGNDTPATATDLGELESSGLVQVAGIIGDDTYYDFSSLDPSQRPGNDVDLYHFRINSTSGVGLIAEVFAGRIGSPLDAGISLYRLNPTSGKLEFVTGNNQTQNSSKGTDGSAPLVQDPAIVAGLEAGDYYLAVSSGFNTVSPTENQPGRVGVFDPTQSHSGFLGFTTGQYILNLRTVTIGEPPQVVSVSIPNQSTLPSAPAEFTIQFNEYINIAQLAMSSYSQNGQSIVPGLYIQDSQGNRYSPHLISFDAETFTARFRMSDRLPPGRYQLHIDGSQGLTNIVGTALVGGTSSVNFTVTGKTAGTAGNPSTWTYDPNTDATGSTQQLGILFPNELAAGVAVVRNAGTGSNRVNDASDEYRFEVLKSGRYYVSLSGNKLPAGTGFDVLDLQGNVVGSATIEDGGIALLALKAGTYVLRVQGWSASAARNANYRVAITSLSNNDDPPPLFSGPAPAIGIRLATAVDPGFPGGPVGGGTGGGGVGPGAGIPGIGNSDSLSFSHSPNDYNLNRLGLPRLNIPSGLDNFVIAIPTLNSDSGSGLGPRLQVARSLRRSAGLGDGLAPARLSEFADGPVGKASRNNTDLKSNLTTVRKLSRLIDSAIISKHDKNAQQPSQTRDVATHRNDAPFSTDRDNVPAPQGDANGEAIPAEQNTERIDPNHTTETDVKRSNLNAQIHNVNHTNDLHAFEFQTANDSAFIPYDPNFDNNQVVESTALQSAYLPDTVFAAGMGLLLANAAMQQRQDARSGELRRTEVHSTSPANLPTSQKKRLPR